MPEISTTGKWVDAKTGQVVDGQPEVGRQLVAAGGVVTANVQFDIDAAQAAAPATEQPVEEPVEEKDEKVETASADNKVETATADSKTTTRSTK